MNIYYQNNKNQIIDLSKSPFFIDEPETLSGWENSYEAITNTFQISRFYKEIKEKTINLQILADTKEEFNKSLNNLYSILNYDISVNVPGYLFYNGNYLRCFIVSAEHSDYDELFYSVDTKLKLIAVNNPVWINEKKYVLSQENSVESTTKLNYPFNLPFNLCKSTIIQYANVDGIYPADCQIKIFGLAVNPNVKIGNYSFLINDNLKLGETVTIDTFSKTIIKTLADGTTTNAFNSRDKSTEFFVKIPVGKNQISRNGKFKVEIKIYDEAGDVNWIV